MKNYQWVFTCSMQPLIFKEFLEGGDDFVTVGNIYDSEFNLNNSIDAEVVDSYHSSSHCGLNYISQDYAMFFIKNKFWEIYKIIHGVVVKSGTEWVRLGTMFHFVEGKGCLPVFTRTASNGMVFIYTKYRKKYQLIGIQLGEFTYNTNSFRKDRDCFDFYEKYVKFVCGKFNVQYEGV